MAAAPLASLQRHMADLEEMLKEVEAVSAVLDFDLPPSREGAQQGKLAEVTPRSTSHGVNVLAADVAEALKSWRAQKEREHERRTAERVAQLRDYLREREREEQDSVHVRDAVRAALTNDANSTIEDGLADMAERPTGGALASSGGESAGGWALLQLQTRLEELVGAVEGRDVGEPWEMRAAGQSADQALEAKAARANGAARRAGFLDLTGHLDTELVDEAAAVGASRQRLLSEQAGRREGMLKCLREAAEERQRDFDMLVATERRSPGPLPPEAWQALQPPDGEEARAKSPAREAVLEEILEIGDGRLEVMVQEFASKFLPGAQSKRAADVEGELEIWRLRSRQALLRELGDSSEQFHKQCLGRLQLSMEHGKETPYEQLTMAISVAEEFRGSRNEHFARQLRLVEEHLRSHSQKSLAGAAARRRRAEWTALRRMQDMKEAVKLMASASDIGCLLQLGRAAHRLVKECHGALPMLAGGLEHAPKSSRLAAACPSFQQGLTCAERAVQALPDSAEACAILKGLLCVLDKELLRTCGVLQELEASCSSKIRLDTT